MGRVLAGVLCLAAASLPEVALAQACCTATGSGEFGFVGPCRDAIVAAELAWDHAVGSWDADGRWRALETTRADDAVLTLGGGFRFADRRLQLRGTVPFRLQNRHFDAVGGSTSGGVGDVTGAFGWTVVDDPQAELDLAAPETLVPYVDLTIGVRAPSGRAPHESQDPAAADVTGDGSWEAFAGAKVTKFLTSRHALTVGASYGHRFARTVAGRSFEPGEAVSLRLSWLYIPNLFWSGGAFSTLALGGAALEDDEVLPRSATRRLRVGVYATHAFDLPYWEGTLTLASDIPFSGAGANLPFAGTTVAFSVQRAFL